MAVVPTPDQMQAMAEKGPDGPIVMVNLVKYRDRAGYEQDRAEAKEHLSGREAYQRYGMTTLKHVNARGGAIVWMGPQALVFIGGPEQELFAAYEAFRAESLARKVTPVRDAIAAAIEKAGNEQEWKRARPHERVPHASHRARGRPPRQVHRPRDAFEEAERREREVRTLVGLAPVPDDGLERAFPQDALEVPGVARHRPWKRHFSWARSPETVIGPILDWLERRQFARR